MSNKFVLPSGMMGRFGVVKLWPHLRTAENECIARLQRTAKNQGLTCVEIDDVGKTIDPPHRQMTQADLDFVIHLHFQTPKAYDIFSFGALWNPLQFYHDFGYIRCSRNLMTHDDFLSCDSPGADDMIARMISSDPTRAEPEFYMFHSLSDPVLEPTLGDSKLFYVGINWERLGKGRSRHQELLKALDSTGDLRIYGPRHLQGVRVWDGYKSYVDELPFDGVSSIAAINKAGIVLVLSSEAHKKSSMMSNRLFEALAGGAVAICDENQFTKKHFGDTILYIDTTLPCDEIVEQVNAHMAWIRNNPQEALKLAREAQAIFNEKFRLDVSLHKIYDGFQQRRQKLESLYVPKNTSPEVTLYLLLPDYSLEILQRHITNFKTQHYNACRAVLVADSHDALKYGKEIDNEIEQSGLKIALKTIAFYERTKNGNIRQRHPRGRILADILRNDDQLTLQSLYSFVAPNEVLFSNHIQGLVGTLEANPERTFAFSYSLLRQPLADAVQHNISEKIFLTQHVINDPSGYGRMMFRRTAQVSKLEAVLPYLDILAPLGLTSLEEGAVSPRATIVIDVQDPFNIDGKTKEDERNILRDQNPARFDFLECAANTRDYLAPTSLSLENLLVTQKRRILCELIQSLPLPNFVRAVYRPPWRFFLRLYRRHQAN